LSALGQPLEKPVAVGDEEEEVFVVDMVVGEVILVEDEVVDAADDVLLTRHEVSRVLFSSFPLGLLQSPILSICSNHRIPWRRTLGISAPTTIYKSRTITHIWKIINRINLHYTHDSALRSLHQQ
jgi:hypothetical protein